MPPSVSRAAERPGELDDVPPAGVHGEQDAAGLPRRASLRPCPRRAGPVLWPDWAHCGPLLRLLDGRRPPAAAPASRRSHRKNSTLPAGPGSGLATTPAVPQPSDAAAAADLQDGLHPVLGVAHHSPGAEPLPAHLELRLDHRQQVGVRRAAQAVSAGQHQAQRDEGQVGDDEVDRAVDRLGRQGADVGALVDAHPLVGAQRPGELAVARRRRRRPRRRRGCSSTSVKPPVEAPASSARRPSTVDRERLERAEQLVRAAGDPAGLVGVGADDDRGAGVDAGGRLGGGPTGDGDPALGDQRDGVLAGAGQAPPHELGVEPAATGHQSWSIVPSSRCEPGVLGLEDGHVLGDGPLRRGRRTGRAAALAVRGRRPAAPARAPSAGTGAGRGGPGTGRGGLGSVIVLASRRSVVGTVRSAAGGPDAAVAGRAPVRCARRGYRPGTTGTARRSRGDSVRAPGTTSTSA